jgi:HAD superfamily hydrolase (TIGR01662 family)
MPAWDDIDAIIFDIGGTLLDFDQPESLAQLREGIACAHRHLTERGHAVPSLPRYRRRVRRAALVGGLRALVRRREVDTLGILRSVHRRLRITLDDAALDDLGRAFYQPTMRLARAQSTTATALATLAERGYRLGIVSNTVAPPAALDDHLARDGLLAFFQVRVYSCAFGVAKPNPRIFRAALDRLSVTASRSVYVGDKLKVDIRGAQNVGMRAILRTRGRSVCPRGPRPDALIREIADLPALLAGEVR